MQHIISRGGRVDFVCGTDGSQSEFMSYDEAKDLCQSLAIKSPGTEYYLLYLYGRALVPDKNTPFESRW